MPDAPSGIVILTKISSDWAPSQVDQILDGVALWQGVLGGDVKVELSIEACDSDTEGCIAPVDADAPQLEEAEATSTELAEGAHVVGLCQPVTRATSPMPGSAISMVRDFPLLTALAAHEFGHRIGLQHPVGGVMTVSISGDLTVTDAALDKLSALGLR